MIPDVKKTAKQILAANLQALMNARADLKTQGKIAAKASKAGGKKVAQTSISNMLKPESPFSPTLANVEAVASVFGLQAWQLVHPTLGDESAAGEVVARLVTAPKKDQSLIYQILEMDTIPDYKVKKHLPPVHPTKTK